MTRVGPRAVIAGKYRLEELLGRGGMGSVWRAETLETGSKVALKLLEKGDDTMRVRFAREARAASALQSPHVVEILDHGFDEGTAFIAMELLVGESLRSRIARTRGLLAVEALRFVGQVLGAIQKAHEAGIVHRDLKPDNVFIVKGSPEFVKVLDFGIAKLQKTDVDASSSMTDTGMMIGTPYYMSPEQAQAQSIDHRSDLFTIAVILFEALTGRRPFAGESFGDLVVAICTSPVPIPSNFGKVPRGFDEWFVRGTQRDRVRRFQSAREMADELARIATNITLPLAGLPAIVAPRTVPPPAALPSDTASAIGGASDRSPLELTTGQHAAVSRGSSARPREPFRAGLVALVALGVVIVAGVCAFVLGGGASALRAAETARRAAERPSAPAAAPPVERASLPSVPPEPRPSASVMPRASAVPARPANPY